MILKRFSRKRAIALFLLIIMSVQVLVPSTALALTSGPSQPEFQSFQPAGATEMVNLFTGDFSYNIPLFELPGPNGGYPFNLSYQAGITMDQEASWVGLGWTLQPGAINRQMRGLPDEFNGDEVYTKTSIAPNYTVGLGAGATIELFGSDKSVAQIGFSIYQNTYKGLGYTLDASVGFSKTNDGLTSSVGLGISLDNNEGVGVSPSIGLGGKLGQFGLSAPYNSKEGLTSISLDHSVKGEYDDDGKTKELTMMNSSASLSLARSGYTPQVSMPMNTISISAQLKFGGAWWGIFGSPYLTGYHTKQYLTTDKKRIPSKAFGYLNYQHAQTPYEATGLLDFNREKDGMVAKETPNLGIPSLTYDIYSVTGQGISMMYRPMRTDYGTIYDPATTSGSTGTSFGVDVGVPTHGGGNLTINHANSFSGKWTDADNQLATKAKFQGYATNSNYEPWVFKVHGESVSTTKARHDSIGGDRPVRVKLTGDSKNPIASATLEPRSGASLPVPNNADLINRGRYPRNQVVTPIKNGELLSSSGVEMISLFKVNYIDSTGTLKPFNRSNALDFPKHHFAGYTALTGDGLRYVYALPAYNLQHEEVQFSVPHQSNPNTTRVNTGTGAAGDPNYSHANTDKYLKRTEIPRYAHSYLLTAIVGPDYVDLTNDGVTPDDLGYWVKFTYKKTTDDYKWRDPFRQAHLQEGWRHDYRDDKGAFTYGKKQLFYLTRAETKSHIAEFEMAERSDARGVLSKLQDTNGLGKSVFALQQIKLFTRSAGSSLPIKTTRFEYDNSLCLGIDNGTSGQGKLTLKKVWFEYGGSQRGELNPYEFTYHSNNPNYDILTYDRWGNYRPYPENKPRYNVDFPYVNQDPLSKADLDAEVASWSLTEIKLPSGGTIKVDYESDDYAYVQNKEAMQMMAIVNPYQNSSSITASPFALDQNNYKIRFKLEQPIEGTLTPTQQTAEVRKYLDTQSWQLYLKLKINLRKAGEGYYEFINGYADINKTGAMGLETDASGKYAYGYFQVMPEKKKHPFSMRAWQHLRTNQPDLANIGKRLDPAESTGDKINQMKGLGGLGAQIRQMFEGFYNYCDNKNWGKQIDPTQSWIRLKSPDLVKYGGGLRVKQITMTDAWSHDNRGTYGQYYDYTTMENGNTISSGVAAYEPQVGGEENPLRIAKKFVQSVPLKSDNNLIFEYPVNESNYPGPQVGYSKVAVMSLPSAVRAGKTLQTPVNFPASTHAIGTTGMTIHEFYTARDFPVIADETDKTNKTFNTSLPIPFLGNVSVSKLAASQGYSIITNDMHGKSRKVSQYRQTASGEIQAEPFSWVQYNYLQERKTVNGKSAYAVKNVFRENDDETLSISLPQDGSSTTQFNMGQETEFFYDMRQYDDVTQMGGVRINLDVLVFLFVTIPAYVPWPSIGSNTKQLRVATTNKIIFKTGILQSIEAYNEGSHVKTRHEKWDRQTGQPVLTVVNNNYDNPVFSYSRPAFREYEGMGAAYHNIGLQLSLSSITADPNQDHVYQFNSSMESHLQEGDELLLYANSGAWENALAKVVYMGKVNGVNVIYSPQSLISTTYKGLIVRSGRRNHLNTMVENIVALSDPTLTGATSQHSKVIQIPK